MIFDGLATGLKIRTSSSGRGGVVQNDREAVRLLRLSADQGDELGEINLGICYAAGLFGLPKDAQEAVRLFRLAIAQDGTGEVVVMLYRKEWSGVH